MGPLSWILKSYKKPLTRNIEEGKILNYTIYHVHPTLIHLSVSVDEGLIAKTFIPLLANLSN